MMKLSELVKTLIGVDVQTEKLDELMSRPEKYVHPEDLEKVNKLLQLLNLSRKIK